MKENENNKMRLIGKIVSKPKYAYEIQGEGFFEFDVAVERLSGTTDVIPATISERLLMGKRIDVGETIYAVGQFRSFNKVENGRSRLKLTAFIQELLPVADSENTNRITLKGYVCKPPIYRTTPSDREIADVMIAVNRAYNKSDYIPCVIWGRNARFASTLALGDMIAVSGRLQSREYQKKLSETESKTMTAYEVSVSRIELCCGSQNVDLDEDFNKCG